MTKNYVLVIMNWEKWSQNIPLIYFIVILFCSIYENFDIYFQVKGYGTVKITTPEMATITSDLLQAYRLSQSLRGQRPYKYNPEVSRALLFA